MLVKTAIFAVVITKAAISAESFGKYTDGYIFESVALKKNAHGIQTMRPTMAKFYGHNKLRDFIYELGKKSIDSGNGQLLIGDLSHRDGGLLLGHASHQNGLDVDIWFYRPADTVTNLADNQRDSSKFPHFLNPATNEFYPNMWNQKLDNVLKIAASDSRVAKIFVNAGVKRRLCHIFPGEKFLSKIRPWYRHHEHFHVRLNCPKNSPHCESQPEIKALDCSGQNLDWWFGPGFKKEYQRRYGK